MVHKYKYISLAFSSNNERTSNEPTPTNRLQCGDRVRMATDQAIGELSFVNRRIRVDAASEKGTHLKATDHQSEQVLAWDVGNVEVLD